MSEIRLAARQLLKNRGFTAAAIITLALGLAATNTVFTVLNGLLLRDMPFAEPDRLVEMSEVSHLDLRDWQQSTRTFAGIGGVDERPMTLADESGITERILGGYVSANAFSILGRPPVVGRDFQPLDDEDGATPVVMLGHDLWKRRYGSDPAVIGHALRINGVPSVVVGVMPEGFQFPMNAQLWQTLAAAPSEVRVDRTRRPLDSFGRLRPGVTIEQARSDLQTVVTALERSNPARNRALQPVVEPYRSGIARNTPAAAIFLFMMAAVIFVLLIACANVTNLWLARAAARSRDVSLRRSLGASRWRIVRQLLAESLLLAAVSGAVALALSAAGIRLFTATLAQTGDAIPYWLKFPFDMRVFAFLGAVCLGVSVLVGLLPALQTSRGNLAELLSDATRGSVGHRHSQRWSGALVTGQLALALVLLSGAGAAARNLLALVHVDVGVETTGLVRMGLVLPVTGYELEEQRRQFFSALDARLAPMRATLASATPNEDAEEVPIFTGAEPQSERPRRRNTAMVAIGPRYFETLGIALRSGRSFSAEPAGGVAVVNRRFVDVHLAGVAPLGSRFRTAPDGEWLTVVGVVDNVRQNRNGDGFEPVVYVPLDAMPPANVRVLVRSDGDVAAVASQLRAHVRALDVDVPLFDIHTVDEEMAIAQWPQRVFGSMFAIFAGIAIVLAAVGLYAVTAYAAAQRRQEMGIRLALGAQARQIWWLVSRRAGRQLAAGLIVGGAGALALGRILPSLVFGTFGGDPLTIAGVAALLIVVALAAVFVPARRAMRLNPIVALRAE